MALNGNGNMPLGVGFTGTDGGLKSTLNVLAGAFDKMKQAAIQAKTEVVASFKEFKAALEPIKAVFASFQGLQNFADQAGSMRSALKQLELFGGATKEQIAGLKEQLFSSAVALRGFDPTQAAQAAKELGLGLGSAAGASKALMAALDLANLTGSDTAETGQTMARAVKAFGLEADEARKVTDTFAFGMTRFQVRGEQVLGGLQKLTDAATKVKSDFGGTALAAFLAAKQFGDFEKGAAAVSSATEAMARAGLGRGSDQLKAFARGGVSVAGALERILKTNPSPTLAQVNAMARNLGPAGDALVAMFKTLRQEVDNSNGRFKTQREAMTALRAEFEKTGGAGSKLALQNAGTAKVMSAAWTSFKTQLADVLSDAFAPLKQASMRAMIGLLDFFNAIPRPVKDAVAQFIFFGLKVAAAFGVFLAGRAAIMLVWAALTGLIPILAAEAVAMAPLLLQFGLAIIAFEALKVAYEENLGGIRDFFLSVWKTVSLAWKGLMQAFATGELSGNVLTELEKAENNGILKFVIAVYSAGSRLKEIVLGIGEGFRSGLKAIEPALLILQTAWERLVSAFGGGGEGIIQTVARLPWAQFRDFGKQIGQVASKIAEVLVTVLGYAFEFIGGLVRSVRAGWDFLAPALKEVWTQLKNLGAAVVDLFSPITELFNTTGAGASKMGLLGDVIGGVLMAALTAVAGALSIVIGAIATVIDYVKVVIGVMYDWGKTIGQVFGRFIQMIGDVVAALQKGDILAAFKAIGAGIRDIFLTIVDFIRDQIDRMMGFVARVLAKIPVARTQFKEFIAEAQARDSLRAAGQTRGEERRQQDRIASETEAAANRVQPLAAATVPLIPLAQPGVVAVGESGGSSGITSEQLTQLFRAAQSSPIQQNIQLQVGEKTLAEIVRQQNRDDATAASGDW